MGRWVPRVRRGQDGQTPVPSVILSANDRTISSRSVSLASAEKNNNPVGGAILILLSTAIPGRERVRRGTQSLGTLFRLQVFLLSALHAKSSKWGTRAAGPKKVAG